MQSCMSISQTTMRLTSAIPLISQTLSLKAKSDGIGDASALAKFPDVTGASICQARPQNCLCLCESIFPGRRRLLGCLHASKQVNLLGVVQRSWCLTQRLKNCRCVLYPCHWQCQCVLYQQWKIACTASSLFESHARKGVIIFMILS